MITSIRIKNLRSLADTGWIQIKPITLLLGSNSSGKSTFLRSFPLFTQSINKSLRGPISWFDDSFVDFGDYDTAKNRFASPEDKIQFFYELNMPFTISEGRMLRLDVDIRFKNVDGIKASFSLSNDAKGTYVSSVSYIVEGIEMSYLIKDRDSNVEFTINGAPVDIKDSGVTWNATTYSSILPHFEFNDKQKNRTFVGMPHSMSRNHGYFYNNIIEFVKARSDSRLQKTGRIDVMLDKWWFDKGAFLLWLKNAFPITSFRNYVQDWTEDNEEFVNLYNMIALYKLFPLWELFDSELSFFYIDCSYIAPTRAEANRYYRTQGLQVNDIDPYGKNLQEFISSLTTQQLSSYNRYIEKTLGIRVKTKSTAGHQSIILHNDWGEFNMTDVGFGYSQILPIVTKLWYAKNYRSTRAWRLYLEDRLNSVLLMEQPELHLHPAYQAKIADAFVKSVTEKSKEDDLVRLIIETHSDTILNRVGRRVREGIISPEDVNILLFEKKIGDPTTQIRQTTFNKKGQVEEWPYGFFDPNDD